MTVVTAPARPSAVARRVALAALFVWGVVHVVGGFSVVFTSGPAAFEAVGTAAAPADLPAAPGPVVVAVLDFLMFLIGSAGIAVTVATVATVRRQWPAGIVPVLVTIGVSDLGLILYLLIPGHMALADGVWGPLLFVIAVAALGVDRRGRLPATT